MKFQDLNLPAPILKAIEDLGFTEPTPIQKEAIPAGLSRRDIIGCAQTGTGKTAAFGIPLIVQLMKGPRKTALVLVPTRELALQVASMLEKLTAHVPELKPEVLIGGMPMGGQMKAIAKNPRILIATPGRLVDHLRRGHLSLRTAEILVLDEADRMLDMGFIPQLNEVMRFVPTARQTFLFSATMPPPIEKIAGKYMKSPVRISVGAVDKPVDKIAQKAVFIANSDKKKTLNDELKIRQGSVIVFTRTKHRADRVCRDILAAGLTASRIHGGRSQAQRVKALDAFREGKFQILVATDIAARGIDVAHVAHVINFDLPRCPDDYIHRVGRTARAGLEGQALSLVSPEERGTWKKISQLI